jgi:predicted HicB family RNase H-like nuclease
METDKITFIVDKELKTQLKIIAVQQNKTITEIVTSLIQEYVNENK